MISNLLLPVRLLLTTLLPLPGLANDGGVAPDLTVDSGTADSIEPEDDVFWQQFDALDGGAESDYETEVFGYRIRRTDEGTGFAETIEIANTRKTVESVSDVLSKAVGVQVRSMGGLGAYGSASIRGSTPNQVPVFLDRVQLNTGGSGVVDLGNFSLDLLESIEVYRGTAPIALGTSGIGGAIVLKTRTFDAPITEAAVSYGSWNTWRVFALRGDIIGPLAALALFSGQGSDGDFIYYNRNGTNFTTEDDSFVKRANNHHVAYSGLVKLNTSLGAWEPQLMNEFLVKRQGIPGTDYLVGEHRSHTELRTLRDAINISLGRSLREKYRIDFDAAYLLMREDFNDMEGEVGIGHQRAKYSSDALSGAAVLHAELSEQHISNLRLGVRYEQFKQNELNLAPEDQQSPRRRLRFEVGLEHEWIPVPPLKIVPVVRTELHHSNFGGGPTPDLLTDFEPTSVTDFFFSPSLGARYEIADGLTLKANGGRYVRAPELTELFGDRGGIHGNPGLVPEVGYNGDAGATYIMTGIPGLSLLRVDAAWFGSWVDDLIILLPNSQSSSKSVNYSEALIQGLESALRVQLFKIITLSGNYTYFYGINKTDDDNYYGKRLPGRPRHEVYGRIDLEKRISRVGIAGWFDVDYASKAYVGLYNNEAYVSMHLFLGLGGRVEIVRPGLSLTLEVKNLLDSLVFKNDEGAWMSMCDFDRYPLPGRTIMGTIHWKMP